MADITWTEGTGSDATTMTLGSLRPDPANRFFECVPGYVFVGPRKVALTRAIHTFAFREDYTIHVVIKHLSPSQHETALMLMAHLISGGEVTLNTDDVDDNVYENLQLNPGTTPGLTSDDDERQHFSFTVDLASDEPMTVNYDG